MGSFHSNAMEFLVVRTTVRATFDIIRFLFPVPVFGFLSKGYGAIHISSLVWLLLRVVCQNLHFFLFLASYASHSRTYPFWLSWYSFWFVDSPLWRHLQCNGNPSQSVCKNVVPKLAKSLALFFIRKMFCTRRVCMGVLWTLVWTNILPHHLNLFCISCFETFSHVLTEKWCINMFGQ